MARVRLIPLDDAMMAALTDGGGATEERCGVWFGECLDLARDVARQTAEFHARVPREPPWGSYMVADAKSNAAVGTCGFKHAPTAEGVVEIAYFTFPSFEGRGYATAAVGEMVRIALEDAAVRRVIAHTLPEENASGRLLTKCGLRRVGEVVDPEDGPVWRWELERGS